MKKIAIVTATILSLGVADLASARDPIKDAISARAGAFTLIAANMKPMGAMAEGKAPFSQAEFAKRAGNIAALSSMPWEFFIPGSDKGQTEAKAEVWSKPDDFKAAAAKFQEAATKLAAATQGGDETAIKTQFGAMAKTCKSCHQTFKAD